MYTSLAYHNIELLTDHPHPDISIALRAFSIGYAKCIDLAYNELCKSHISDGEDCWLDHYGLSINMVDSVEAVLTLMSHAVEQILDETLRQRLGQRMVCLVPIASSHQSLLMFLSQGQPPQLLHSLSRCAATDFFADVSGRLRQCMPLPPIAVNTLSETWTSMRGTFFDLQQVAERRGESDWRVSAGFRAS